MKARLPLIIASIFLVISISVFFYVRASDNFDKSQSNSNKIQSEVVNEVGNVQEKLAEIQELDIVYGVNEAPIKIIEYASYGCSHCASFYNNVYPNLLSKYVDNKKVQLILRDFPLDEPSLRASQLVHCMPGAEKKNMIKALFESQKNWAYSKSFPEKLENLAKISGMSGGVFHECIKNSALEEKILKSRVQAYDAFKINSTPSLIINGQKYIGDFSWNGLAAYLENILK